MNVAFLTARPSEHLCRTELFGIYLNEKLPQCLYRTFVDYEEIVENAAKEPQDIVFYDTVGVPEETARQNLCNLRDLFPQCTIVILAEDERHAVFGYSVRAFEYVIEPVEETWMKTTLEQIIREKHSELVSSFHVRIKGAWTKLDIRHICYMETFNHHIIFHMDNGKEYQRTGNFKDIGMELSCSPLLFQCHKSYVVNGMFVSQMTQESFLMKDGRKINISRPYRKASRKFYAQSISQQY